MTEDPGRYETGSKRSRISGTGAAILTLVRLLEEKGLLEIGEYRAELQSILSTNLHYRDERDRALIESIIDQLGQR